MKDYQQRVVDERSDLDEKIGKLEGFLARNYQTSVIPPKEKLLLGEQLHHMTLYASVLTQRIKGFK